MHFIYKLSSFFFLNKFVLYNLFSLNTNEGSLFLLVCEPERPRVTAGIQTFQLPPFLRQLGELWWFVLIVRFTTSFDTFSSSAYFPYERDFRQRICDFSIFVEDQRTYLVYGLYLHSCAWKHTKKQINYWYIVHSLFYIKCSAIQFSN